MRRAETCLRWWDQALERASKPLGTLWLHQERYQSCQMKKEDKKEEQGSTLHGVAISQEFKDHKSMLKKQEFTDNTLGRSVSPSDWEPLGFCFSFPPKPLTA